MSVEVVYHPLFQEWFARLLERDEDIAAEVMALITALEEGGAALGDPESHPVVISDYRLRTLRRTPPTGATPYATGPPVLRVLYGFASPPEGGVGAVVLLAGDKTEMGNQWYPAAVAEAERRLVDLCGRKHWRIVKTRWPDA